MRNSLLVIILASIIVSCPPAVPHGDPEPTPEPIMMIAGTYRQNPDPVQLQILVLEPDFIDITTDGIAGLDVYLGGVKLLEAVYPGWYRLTEGGASIPSTSGSTLTLSVTYQGVTVTQDLMMPGAVNVTNPTSGAEIDSTVDHTFTWGTISPVPEQLDFYMYNTGEALGDNWDPTLAVTDTSIFVGEEYLGVGQSGVEFVI
jgi:hypothetical protein